MPSKLRRLFELARRSSPVGTFGFFRQDLASLLASAESAETLGEKVHWVEDFVAWIRLSAAPEVNARGKGPGTIQAVRVRYFLQALERNPTGRAAVSKLLTSLLLGTDAIRLFSETGLPSDDGFVSEAVERGLRHVLPTPRDDRDLGALFSRIFTVPSDADWLRGLDAATVISFFTLVFPDEETRLAIRTHFLTAMRESLILLSSQVEALGLSSEIRVRSEVRAASLSAFYRLREAVSDTLEGRREPSPEIFWPLFGLCAEEISSAFRHLEEHGVSVAIVYRLEKMERNLGRMASFVAILFSRAEGALPAAWLGLLAELVRAKIARDSMRSLVQSNLHMLARKIVERTGASGEHYITSSPREYFTMLLSAAGGGVLTAGTALLKVFIAFTHPALFFEGLFSWFNYSGSFLLMQAFHFTLATKQPSMTASALAAKLKEAGDLSEFAELVARLTRSQFAAALGNIGAAVPTAFAIDWLFFRSTGTHMFSAEYAHHTVESLHPWRSPTVAYAALTGIVLWVASIGAGWMENFFVYRRLPETMSQSPWLKTVLGPARAARFAGWVTSSMAGIGGSVTLGFLLAFIPISGRFFGLPLDVRHVTLSTAALTFSFCALPETTPHQIALGAISIALIGMLNFGVSFVAALFTALKARDVRRERLGRVRRALWVRMRRAPASFLLPPLRGDKR